MSKEEISNNIKYVSYESELQMPDIMQLCGEDLSEPYTVYTYRYFIHNWPKFCFLAYNENKECIGAIVCKLDDRHKNTLNQANRQHTIHPTVSAESDAQQTTPQTICRGYIAMLVVKKEYRKLKIGTQLVKLAVNAMKEAKANEIMLETEVTNKASLKLYENLGFLRDKRLYRYYLNGLDALQLKLWLT